MEQNMTVEQINAIRQQRQQRFQQMGVTNAGQMMNESTVSNGGKTNLNILQKIQQIKSGAAKQELSKYVNATAKPGGLPGVAGFDAIPVSKPKGSNRNPNVQQSVDPNFKVELDSFKSNASHIDNSELSMIDAMFAGGGSGGGRMSPQQLGFDSGQPFMQQRGQNTQLDLDSTLSQMPSFNPATAINRAKAKAANGQGPEFLRFAQSNPVGKPEDYMDPNVAQQFNNMGITPAMKIMMETIAKTMAEQTIRKVLSEFTEQKQQQNKNTFEVYNKDQNIIKTSDGKLYKITPVQVKKK
jgi:hypothetical protein